MEKDGAIDLNATISALDAVLAGKDLTEDQREALADMSEMLKETLSQLGSTEH